jgi:drug/metabolite transporter (DMT)-like permease
VSPPAHQSLRDPRNAGAFALVALIWGSTWWVITTQIDDVPALWSVTHRFLLAAPAMALVAVLMGHSLAIGARAHRLAMVIGLTQFCGNYAFVYEAEHHLTSGIVALIIALLLVPNALLGWLMLGQTISRRFALGSAVAIAGIALLLVNEARLAPLGGHVWLGVALALGGLLAAAIANVVQAGDTGRSVPMASLLAWSMAYGAVIDATLAWLVSGPPVWPRDLSYWAGAAYLAFAGSVVTFPLYFKLVRDLGAGRAAYNGVFVVVLAMLLSTLFEGYRWTGLAITGSVLAMAGLVVALSSARRPSR